MTMQFRSGRIDYLSAEGAVRGQEWFQITRDSAGVLTGRALAMTFDSGFVRDASLAWGPGYELLDATIRLRLRSEAIGSGYFALRDGILGAVADMTQRGRVEQVVILPRPYSFVTHSVAFDAWHFFHYDHAQGGTQVITAYNSSTRWDGTDGPIGALQTYEITREATELVRVPAGEFEATRWRLHAENARGQGLIVWATTEDKVFVKIDWPERSLSYVLAEYRDERLGVP